MPPHLSYPYTGRVVIRLDQATVDYIVQQALSPAAVTYTRLDQVAHLPGFNRLADLLASLPGNESAAATDRFSVGLVHSLEREAQASPFPPLHSLISYFYLDLRRVTTPVDVNMILAELNSPTHPHVDAAYLERELREAGAWAVHTANDPLVQRQGYLHGGTSGPYAYSGINVYNAAVWGKYNGTGVGFVDLERGWNFGHNDLPQAAHLLYNLNRYDPLHPTRGDHGTAVLGIIAAVDNVGNSEGILGIAPGARFLRAVSRRKSQNNEWDVVGAILAALQPGIMAYGDVLLIEVETVAGRPIQGYPIEIVDDWFDAIRLAVGNGRVVIEPAGNGTLDEDGYDVARDLDKLSLDWPNAPTWRSLSRHDANFLDSGAIMVSACASAVAPAAAHERLAYAGYGSRVDCYAWGEDVFTTGGGDAEGVAADENTWYTDSFGGTSAASAIIAGAAILVQEMALDVRGSPLSPTQVRVLLSRRSLGTKILDTGHVAVIGVMPDLAKVAGEVGVLPDVYIRDTLADIGEVPNVLVYQSPDIIVTTAQSSDPAADYGATSGLAEAIPPNDQVAPGQPNYIYVRMRNRTMTPAVGVTATVYWSEASSLVAPVHWQYIGTTQPVNVPGGGVLTVAGPVQWIPQAALLAASGHGCFVATIDHALDPAPPLLPANDPSGGGPTSWSTFLAYIGNSNNVAWRNFSVVQASPGADGLQAFADFVIRGNGEEVHTFTFEILQRLERGTRVELELPRVLAARLRAHPHVQQATHETEDAACLQVRPRRLVRFTNLRMEARESHPCRLHVRFPKGARLEGQCLSIRQLCGRTQVGRLSWEFVGGE